MVRHFVCLVLLFPVMGPPELPSELPGLHNLNAASETVLAGSQPEGDEAFAELKQRGITTIISVDGAVPDVAAARRHGLRYIHIPFGYDGIPVESARALARVAKEVTSPIYIHCHHGKHRGPAAAAVVCLSAGSLSHEEAVELMTRAGTGKNYTGLWRDVKNFKPPGPEVKLPELVESAELEPLVATMARLDRHFDNLKLCAKAGWKIPEGSPELDVAGESLLVQEGLREASRQPLTEYDDQFRTWMKESESLADDLFTAVKDGDTDRASRQLKAVEQSCQQCHQMYRNQ